MAKPARAQNSAKTARRGTPFETGNAFAFKPGTSGNPGGRPKSHDDLRDLIQELAAEETRGKGKPTRLVVMLRKMLAGKDARDHANILEHGYGNVQQELDISGDINLLTPEQLEVKRKQRWASVAPALAAALSEPGSE